MTEEELRFAYAAFDADRAKHTNAVLDCPSSKIVVVAGPGTGKTHLFQELLQKRGSKSLVLSFVNALVDDLALGLSGMSEVRTLHGFVASYLHKQRDARICPFLPRTVGEDAKILLGREIDFEEVFRSPGGKDDEIRFYKKRKEYYGRYYGYMDATYAVVKDLENKKMIGKLPQYEQILVDEFQDFNDLEVALIDLLAEASPVLIAGDDGQSLYEKLKGADPRHLRSRHSEDRAEYVAFNLPYCSRCPEVVVEAVNDVTREAQRAGLLASNIEKPFRYFKCKDKDQVSEANPKILYFQRAANGVASLLLEKLTEIAERERQEFTVLVIVPPKLKKLIAKLVKSLQKSGFRKLTYPKPKRADRGPSLLDGLKLLLEDKDSNLGWRILARCLMPAEDFKCVLTKSAEDAAPLMPDLLDVNVRTKVRGMRATLNCINQNQEVAPERLADFLKAVDYEPIRAATESLKEDLDSEAAARQSSQRNIRDLPITISTIPGSKGLAADYVFLVYFNPDSLSGPVPTDEDVFNFIVAVTRAKKGLTIVSTTKEIPLFVKWIQPGRVKQNMMPEYEASKAGKRSKPEGVLART